MLATSGGFVAICPRKEVELGADKLLHRAEHAQELRQEIEFPCAKAVSSQYAYLCGGALRAINPNTSMTMAEHENCAAVFKGNLTNKAELALQLVGCPPQLNEAQLLLHLYAAMGLDMLGRLQGQYAFCLYDSKQARVLAARDHSGAVPLLEGRTAAGSLIICCGQYLPEGVHQMVDIQPGEYKYGWHALPRQFKCGAKIVSGRASCDYGIRRRSVDAFNAAHTPHRQQSLDIPSRSHHHNHASAGSGSGAHTPTGRYVPPHAAAGHYSRQRATSLDSGHWGPPPPYAPSSLPSPQASQAMSHFAGRRRSESNSHSGGSSGAQKPQQHQAHAPAQQHQQHHAAKAPPSPASSAAAAAAAMAANAARAPAAAAKAAAAALAAAAAATSPAPVAGAAAQAQAPVSTKGSSAVKVEVPAAASSTPASPGSEGPEGQEAATPASAGAADGASPHRRKRRHRGSRKHKSHSPGAEAGGAGTNSDTESHVSTSTHDSTHSGPSGGAAANGPAAAATAAAGKGGQHKAAAGGGSGKGAAEGAAAAAQAALQGKPAAAAAAAHHKDPHNKPQGRQQHQQHGRQPQGHHKQPVQQQWCPKAKQAEAQAAAVAAVASGQRRSSTGSGSGGGSGAGFKRNGSCGELAALGSSPTTHAVVQVPQQGLAAVH